MFGFSPLRCLPACPLSHSLSLTECSLWHSLFTTGQTVRYLARTKSHAHSRTKMKVFAHLLLLSGLSSSSLSCVPRAMGVVPTLKQSTLSLSLCAVHPWLSSEILVTMVAIPPMAICVRQLPLFPLFPFLHFQFPPPYVIWLRSLLRSPVAQPTTHNPQSTSHIPLSICLTPHPTCHRSGPLESPNSSSNWGDNNNNNNRSVFCLPHPLLPLPQNSSSQ